MPKELLFSVTKKDLVIEYFSGTGAGGQYRNRHPNCVRIKHPPSGALTTGQSNRERPANLREAFENLVNAPLFKVWQSQKIMECLSGEIVEQRVEKQLDPDNLKVEGKDEQGRWVDLAPKKVTNCIFLLLCSIG